MTGTYEIASGTATFLIDEFEAKLAADVPCRCGVTLSIDFQMRCDDENRWRRCGPSSNHIVEKVTGREIVLPQYGQSAYMPGGLTAKAVRDATKSMRDGWQVYTQAHPEIVSEIYRTAFRWRQSCYAGEREAFERLVKLKSARIQRLQEAIDSPKPEQHAKEIWRLLNRSDWDTLLRNVTQGES